MKRVLLLCSLVMAFLMVSTSVYAQQRKAALGLGNIALKVDYISFTEDDWKDLDVENGLYVGLEGYGQIASNLYLGAEIGYANPDGQVRLFNPFFGTVNADTDLTYVPVELNLKYAIEVAPNLVMDFGAGVSYNYTKVEISALGTSADEDDWLFGGQFFADLNYKIGQFFIGINAKYQMTQDLEINDIDTDVSADNWRIGGQVGIIF